jgi:hypothetical protein
MPPIELEFIDVRAALKMPWPADDYVNWRISAGAESTHSPLNFTGENNDVVITYSNRACFCDHHFARASHRLSAVGRIASRLSAAHARIGSR